ncbi:MAG: hypothetical protein JO270_17425 [Acidobacteriaceae bacterium]|nr:hypothetical protein [Acidobacteriaceae bacterium]
MAEAEMTATPLDQATDNDRASPLTTNRNLNEQVTELRVTAHLMALDRGLFCVLCRPVAGSEEDGSGLPGIRISLPPGHSPEVVSISTFRSDGWLGVADGAALIRVNGPRGQILVTIYQNPRSHPESAPRIQVLRLASEPEPVATQLPQSEAAERPSEPGAPQVVAHVQKLGDIGQDFGTWLGRKGSKLWIEGFGISPPDGLEPEDIEYRAVLGKGWLSPWVSAGKFCGSRGMALPLLGFQVRLSEKASRTHTVTYAASFVDGTEIGPVIDGKQCESEDSAPLEALKVAVEKKTSKYSAKSPASSKRAR